MSSDEAKTWASRWNMEIITRPRDKESMDWRTPPRDLACAVASDTIATTGRARADLHELASG